MKTSLIYGSAERDASIGKGKMTDLVIWHKKMIFSSPFGEIPLSHRLGLAPFPMNNLGLKTPFLNLIVKSSEASLCQVPARGEA